MESGEKLRWHTLNIHTTYILSDMFAGFAVGKGEETRAAIRKVGCGEC